MYGQYTVALCDILGFKELVRNVEQRTLVEGLLGQFRRSLHHAMVRDEFPKEVPALADINGNKHVGVAWFSDTLLLYTREDTDECLKDLLTVLGWLLFETMETNIRIRAGVAHGDAFIDPANSLYVGKPIIEAYEWERQQQWAGASLADSAMARMPRDVSEYIDWWVVFYDVPLKGSTSNRLATNWPTGIHRPDTFALEWAQETDVPTEADWASRPSVCEKWKNIKAFHDSVCRHCNRSS